MSDYHDLKTSDIVCVAFKSKVSIMCLRFLWWRLFSIDADFAYWWREFDRCAMDKYVIFQDPAECLAFRKVAPKYSIDPEQCIVIPDSILPKWAHQNGADIVEDFESSFDRLEFLAEHFSTPQVF